MDTTQTEFSPWRGAEVVALYDVSIPGVAERLQRERTAWRESADIEALDENRIILIVRPGGTQRLVR